MKQLKKLKFIVPPKKGIQLDDGELSMLLGGDYCSIYKNGTCISYHNGVCTGASGATLKCGSYNVP